jgi:hypothetical protein
MALTMTIEQVSPFNGLDVLVAQDEGLFQDEGLALTIAPREPGSLGSTLDGTLTRPTTAQGRLLNRGQAAMFQG